MSEAHAQFGADCFKLLQSVPFGSLNKRELELGLLRAGIDAGLVSEESAALASSLGLSLTKANAYLTDLALRQPPLADVDAVNVLIETLQTCEVVTSEKHLSIPLHAAALRIWLERKLAVERLHPGESLRRDVVKLTPLGLLRLLDHSEGIPTPAQALDVLDGVLGAPTWLEDAKSTWTPKTSWRDTLSTFGSATSIAQGLPALLGAAFGG
jgi:hypothetical protein